MTPHPPALLEGISVIIGENVRRLYERLFVYAVCLLVFASGRQR